MKGDRRTEGLELASALIPKAQFEAFFKQFEQDEPASENSGLNEPTEILEIDNYQVLHLKDAEFPYLTIIYTAEQNDTPPALYAFCDEGDSSNANKENAPTPVENIHGTDVYQSYLKQGWDDITKSEEVSPWAIKSWLARHMKQDTI